VVNGNGSQINGYFSSTHNDFQIINSEDPLAGLIVSRNLDAQFKTEVNHTQARDRNSEGKRSIAGLNNG
jgi:hypothetical protein